MIFTSPLVPIVAPNALRTAFTQAHAKRQRRCRNRCGPRRSRSRRRIRSACTPSQRWGRYRVVRFARGRLPRVRARLRVPQRRSRCRIRGDRWHHRWPCIYPPPHRVGSAPFGAKYRPFVPPDTPIHFASASLRVGFVSIPSTTLWVGTESRHPKQEAAQWRATEAGSRR